jgi:D-xylose transport system ATP-binding protein
MTAVLEVREAVKAYGAVRALDGAGLTVGEGEVVALLGDNGAGKSTLVKAISGVHRLDGGEIRLAGRPVAFPSPRAARDAGIDTLHQDLGLFDNLSAVANFRIGRELRRPRWLGRLGLLRERAMESDWHAQLERLQVSRLAARQEVALLSGGQRQAIAVLRAVAFARKLVILDEPTAALGVRQTEATLALLRNVVAEGMAILLIMHNLDQIFAVSDRIVVLRLGSVVLDARTADTGKEEVVARMTGIAGAMNGGPGR